MTVPIDFTIAPDFEDPDWRFNAYWTEDGEVFSPGYPIGPISNIPYAFLDLTPYMIARVLLEHGYRPDHLLIVRLRGADYELARAPLGQLAATPLINTAKPVTHPQRAVRRGEALR